MNCIKCGMHIPETSKSNKYCSYRCSVLYLKSQYRKRKREEINKYNLEHRRLGYGYKPGLIGAKNIKSIRKECLRCGASENLEIHHVKPLMMGGDNRVGNIIVLCRKCHYEFERLTKYFFYT